MSVWADPSVDDVRERAQPINPFSTSKAPFFFFSLTCADCLEVRSVFPSPHCSLCSAFLSGNSHLTMSRGYDEADPQTQCLNWFQNPNPDFALAFSSTALWRNNCYHALKYKKLSTDSTDTLQSYCWKHGHSQLLGHLPLWLFPKNTLVHVILYIYIYYIYKIRIKKVLPLYNYNQELKHLVYPLSVCVAALLLLMCFFICSCAYS